MKKFLALMLFAILIIPSAWGADVLDNIPVDSRYEPADATLTDIADGTINENLVNTANPWAVNEVHSDLATETEAQGYVDKEQLDANGDVVDVAATLASNDSDDMLVTAGAMLRATLFTINVEDEIHLDVYSTGIGNRLRMPRFTEIRAMNISRFTMPLSAALPAICIIPIGPAISFAAISRERSLESDHAVSDIKSHVH